MFNKKVNNIDGILDICLNRILVDGESVEQCLADYPEYHDELKSLLDISIKTQKAMNTIAARPDFKARLRYELTSRMNYDNAPKSSSFKWRLRWAPVALSFCIVLLLSGGGTVAAASDSMPADPLYNVKLASEQVQLFFTFDAAGKADLYTEFVAVRVDEIVSMAYANDTEAMDRSSRIMQDQLAMINTLSNPGNTGVMTTEKGVNSEDGTLGVFSTVTVTETACIFGEDTRIPDKQVTTSQTSESTGMNAITVTKTVTVGSGGEVVTAGDDCTITVMYPSECEWTPPAYVINTDNQELIDTLYNEMMTLYAALANNSGDVLQSLLEAIAILEESYNMAIANIS